MPTFGKTDIGESTWWSVGDDRKEGCKFTLTEAGTITKISIYCRAASGTSDATAYIYSDNNGAPDAKLITSSEVTDIGTTFSWVDFPASGELQAGDYWIILHFGNRMYMRYDAGDTNQFAANTDEYDDGASDPFGGASYTNFAMSMYATYTTAGATYTKTWATDVLFKKLGITKSLAVDAAFQKQDIPKTYVVDSLFQKKDVEVQKQVDVLFKKLDLLKQFGVDVDFLKRDIIKGFGVDARFGALMTQTISRQIDVLLKKLDATKTFGLDVYFGPAEAETYMKVFALDVIFAYRVRLPELWLDENGKIVLNISRPYTWVGT